MARTEVDRFGHPGKWIRSYEVSSDTWFTGSNPLPTGSFGASGVIVSGSAGGNLHLTGGGSVDLSILSTGVVYSFSIIRAEVTSGTVYVLAKNVHSRE